MKTISKKCQPPYFEQILSGAKRFEIRLNHIDIEDIRCDVCQGQGIVAPYYPDDGPQECPKCEEILHSTNLQYEVGDTLELKEWFVAQVDTFSQYTGRAVACRITSLVQIRLEQFYNGDVEGDEYDPVPLYIDEKRFWSKEDTARYGLVVLGIEVIK